MITKNNLKINTLPLMDAFYTLQGEGFHAGTASYFIRLAGCDVGCFWCDVKESWDEKKYPQVAVDQIVGQALANPSRLCVITGGEPLMHNLTLLTQELKKNNFQLHIETSGTYPLSGHFDWVCFSPKRFKAELPEFYDLAHELKVVIFKEKDLTWAEGFAQKINPQCKLFLQPEWEKSSSILPTVIEYVKQNPKWRISLQTHKYMDIP